MKATTTIGQKYTRGLRRLAEIVGPEHFRHGIVLYTGANGLRLDDDRFSACRVSALWRA